MRAWFPVIGLALICGVGCATLDELFENEKEIPLSEVPGCHRQMIDPVEPHNSSPLPATLFDAGPHWPGLIHLRCSTGRPATVIPTGGPPAAGRSGEI